MNEVQDENAIGESLTLKQEAFCRYYTQNTLLFGNQTLSYAEAYGFDLDNLADDDAIYQFKDGTTIGEQELKLLDDKDEKHKMWKEKIEDSTYDKAYQVCATSSSRMLKNAKIDARIIELLGEMMNDKQIDSEIVKVIKQNHDLPAKMRAIAEYNKLKQRIVEKKDITSGGKPINIVFDEVFNDESTITPEAEGGNTESSKV